MPQGNFKMDSDRKKGILKGVRRELGGKLNKNLKKL